MNVFREHHENSIRFGYRCFDRILPNGLIQPFQQPERVIGFFNTYRSHQWVSRDLLRGIANDYQRRVEHHAQARAIPILAFPDGRRDEAVDRYLRRAQPDRVVVILKARGGYRICLVFLKLFERIHAPLAAGLLDPVRHDGPLVADRLAQLDGLYRRSVEDLDRLLADVGLRVAA